MASSGRRRALPGWAARLAIVLSLLGLLAAREWFDPYLVLYLGDLLRPGPPPLALRLDESVSFRLYANTRPHTGKIAALQKGLVLVHRGVEVVEEGYGFGLPLVQYGDLVYCARHAELLAQGETMLAKRYTISVADRWSRFLRVKYKDVAPLGTVVVTYTVEPPDTLRVEVDLAGLQAGWRTAYLMNEQGAIYFPVYEDSSGRRRHGDEVGIWHAVDDPLGCWLTSDASLRFCVETEPGRRRYVGRERYQQYNWVRIYALSWSGIDLVIEPPQTRYAYAIRVQEVGRGP